MKRWKEWMSSLGGALVNPGVPLKKGKTISSSAVSDNNDPQRLTGYSMVQADSLDAVVEMVKTCPHLEHGTVDVAETMQMGMV